MSGMKKTHNLVAVTGTYTDNQGQEKKRYTIVGAAFTREDGSMALKLESVPVGSDWNGWLNLYLPREKEHKDTGTAPPGQAAGAAPADGDFKDDDIPF